MQKTLYFKSANQRHFIEVRNTTESSKKYRIYFTSGNTNLFKIENDNISKYPNFENSYIITVDKNSSAFLEISPRCIDVCIDASVKCYIENEQRTNPTTYTLALSIRKNEYKKGLSDYLGLDKKFKKYEKEINDTFAINSIYPKLTGNIKFRVSSNGSLYLSLMDNIKDRYNKNLFNKRIKEGSDLLVEMKNISDELLAEKDSFYEYIANSSFNPNSVTSYSSQNLDDIYNAGSAVFPSKFFEEQLSITAPLYLEDSIPKYFIIFKKEKYKDVNKKDFFKNLKIIKTFSLDEDAEIGKFIRNTKKSRNYNKDHIKLEWRDGLPILRINGIELTEGTITTKYENIFEYLNKEERLVSEFETYVTNVYRRNLMVSHKIFNFEFLFDDDENEFASYFGMYCDNLDIEDFDINLIEYSNKEKLNAVSNINTEISKLYTNSIKNIESKYVNDGKRIFYLKDPQNNFHFLNDVEKKNNNNVFINTNLDLSNFVCKANTHVINENTDVIDFIPYNEFNFSANFNIGDSFELFELSKKFVFKFESDEDYIIYDNITHFPEDSGVITAELLENQNSISIDDIKDFSQGDIIKLINSDDSIIETPIINISYEGEQSIIRISEDVNIENVQYVDYTISECELINVKLEPTLTQTLARLIDAINKLENVPFTAILIDNNTIRIESNRGVQFDVYLNFSMSSSSLLNVKHFNETVNADIVFSENQNFEISRKRFTSPYPLFANEKMIKLPVEDFIGNSNKKFITGGDIIDLNPNGNEYDKIIRKDDDYLFRINDQARPKESLELFEICKTSVGIFSFYEVKDYDFAKLTTDQNFYTSEYNLIYKKYKPLEILPPAQYYRIKNTGEIDLEITIMYSKNKSFNNIELETLTIRPGSESYFSTFLSDYNIDVFNECIDFKYKYVSGNSFIVTPYFIRLDGVLNSFTPTYPTNALNLLSLKNLSEDLARRGDPDYIKLFNTKSEYSRLQENRIIDNNLDRFINPEFVKWESWDYIDSKGDWLRLSFSKSFGKTGHTSHLSNFEVNTEAHSHEWFMLDEIPPGLQLYEKSQQIYGFDKIDRSLLLDTTTDYFNEYFNSGYPNIKRNNESISFSRKQNYSKIEKIGDFEYETFYKGVKYKFSGEKDLSDYSFAVVNSTRPGNSELSSAFETNCLSDTTDFKCNSQGVLPELIRAVDNMLAGDQTVNLDVTLVQPGAPIHLDGSYVGIAEPFTLPEFTETEFKNYIDLAFQEWIDLIETVYSVEKNMVSNININYTINNEFIAAPVVQNVYNDEYKETAGIGNIRIAVVDDIYMKEKAKTFFVTNLSYDNDFQFLTPTIVINANAFYRKDDTKPANGAFSLLYILVHEIGHIFGLGHTFKEDSIMNPNIKISDNYYDDYPNGLYYTGDGECILETYGSRLIEDPSPAEFSCDSNPKIAKDDYEIIVNDKYKTVTIKIESDIDSYLTLDSKKSYLDIYLTQDFKRIAIAFNENPLPKLEPSDIQVPKIDLSFKSLNFNEDNIYAPFINEYDAELNNFNLGILPEKSYYRLRDINTTDKNYQINAFMLNANSNYYFLNESYDANAQINKTAISKINDNSNTALTVNYPLNNLEYYQNSNFWRISGGNSITNANYKLSLDYLVSILPKMKHVTATENGSINDNKLFNIIVLPPGKIEIKKSKYLAGDINNFELRNTNSNDTIFRHGASFNPKYNDVIFFGVRDDLDFSSSLGIDFFKCNTRILFENPKFGNTIKIRKKVSDAPIYKNDRILNLGSSNSPLYEDKYNILKNPSDSNFYKVFNNETNFDLVSGINDLKTIRTFNGLIFPRFDTIKYKVTPDIIEYNKTTNNLSVSIDYDTAIRNALTFIYEDSYSKIYSKDNLDFNQSLLNFIEKSVLKNYAFNEIQYYEEYSNNGTNYTTDDNGLSRIKSLNSYIELQNLIFNKTIRYDVNFSVTLIFKFI